MSEAAHLLLEQFSQYRAIDVSCHLGQWPYRLGTSSSEVGLQEYATRHNLSAVWVSHLAALFGFDTHTGNEDCLLRCRDHSSLRPMAVINPMQEHWRTEVMWAIQTGFHGVRVAPGFHKYGSDLLIDVARVTGHHGVVMQVLMRLDDARVRHPQSPAQDVDVESVVALIRSVPEARVLVSGLNWVEWQQLTAGLANDVPPTVHADFWHVNGPFGVLELMASDAQHWVFGSGFPVQAPEPTMLQLAASIMSPTTSAAMAHGNAHSISQKHPCASTFTDGSGHEALTSTDTECRQ